jgi:hypothetical protein
MSGNLHFTCAVRTWQSATTVTLAMRLVTAQWAWWQVQWLQMRNAVEHYKLASSITIVALEDPSSRLLSDYRLQPTRACLKPTRVLSSCSDITLHSQRYFICAAGALHDSDAVPPSVTSVLLICAFACTAGFCTLPTRVALGFGSAASATDAALVRFQPHLPLV